MEDAIRSVDNALDRAILASWPPAPDSPQVPQPQGAYVVDAISVEQQKQHSKLDPARVLKKEKQLVYVFSVKDRGQRRDDVFKRFSEVKKFWEALEWQAEACGADLPPFPRHSAFLSGGGLLGNAYEADCTSNFAVERLELLNGLAEALTSATNATGGSLFGLRLVREFFELDRSPLQPVARPLQRRFTLKSVLKRLEAAKLSLEALAVQGRPSLLGAFVRATPCAFCATFVLALTVITLYT